MSLSSLGDALNQALGLPADRPCLSAPKSRAGLIERNKAEILSLREKLHADATELRSNAGAMTVAKWFGLCIQEEPASAAEMEILRNLSGKFQRFHIGNFNEWRTVFALDDLGGQNDIQGFAHLPDTPLVKELVQRDHSLSREQRSRDIVGHNIQNRSLNHDDMKIDLALVLGAKLRQLLPVQSKTKENNNTTAIPLAESDFYRLEKLYNGFGGLQGQAGTPARSKSGKCHERIVVLNLVSKIHTIKHTRAGMLKTRIQKFCLDDIDQHSVVLNKSVDDISPLELLALLLSQGRLCVRSLRS